MIQISPPFGRELLKWGRDISQHLTQVFARIGADKMSWNYDDDTLNIDHADGVVTQQVGLETYYHIKATAAISDGDVVMFTGSVGASGKLTGAPASTGLTNGYLIMGVATQDIALNDFGFVTSFGIVRGIDTSAFSDGDILYYDPTVAGGLTATEPSITAARVIVAAVVNAGTGGSGSLFVRTTVVPSLNALPHPLIEKSASYTATIDDYTIVCDATSGDVTISLPSAASASGHVMNIKKKDSSTNNVIISANGSDTIDGSATVSTNVQWTTITIQADTTAWYIL